MKSLGKVGVVVKGWCVCIRNCVGESTLPGRTENHPSPKLVSAERDGGVPDPLRQDRPQDFASRLRAEGGLIVTAAGESLVIDGMTAREVGSLASKFGFTLFELSTTLRTLEDGYNRVIGRGGSGGYQERTGDKS